MHGQEDSVRRLLWETVPRRGDEVRGGSTVPCSRVPEWKDSRRNQAVSSICEISPWSMARPMETELEATQPATTVRRSDRQFQLVMSVNQPEQSASFGVKCDARAAELPDEDEQGGTFQKVEGLTTVDAEEIPCEFPVEDDFLIDENAEGVDEETVKAIVAGKKKEVDAMEAFGIFDVCEEFREFRHDDPEMEGLYTSGSTSATGRLVDVQAVQHGYSILCLHAENAYFHAEQDEGVYCWPPREWVQEVPHECHQDDFYVSGSNLELALLQENLGARLKLQPAEPMGPGSQYSHLRATRTSEDADTIHIAPRETYIKNVLDILGLGDNKCKPMPTRIVQTRQLSDEDEPRLGEGDRRAYRRCTGILRHLFKYRPDIASAVHEVSKTLASPGDADLRRLRRLGRYLFGTQKLGIMIRMCNDLEHLDAYTDAD